MAYSNYAKTIYEAFRDDILAEVDRLEIEYRDRFEFGDDIPFVAKHGRGIVCRVVNDEQGVIGSGGYHERTYTFELLAVVRDSDRDQHDLTDFCEHIKYSFEQTPKPTTTDSLQSLNITYNEPEEESPFKTAVITVEILHDG